MIVEIFDFIRGVWDKAGFMGLFAVTIMASIIIVAGAIGKDFVMAVIKWLKTRWQPVDEGLLKHELFSHLKLIIDHQIPILEIKCPLRNKIFKRLLEIKFRDMLLCLTEVAKRFEEDEDIDIKSAFTALFIEHNHRWTETAKLAGLPEAAISKFNNFYNAYSKPLESIVQDLSSSQKLLADKRHQKIYIILDIIKSMIIASLLAAEKTLNSLNGEITSVVFEGERCRQCAPICDMAIKH